MNKAVLGRSDKGEDEKERLAQMNGGVFYIDYGGVYVGISPMAISGEALMPVIDSMG